MSAKTIDSGPGWTLKARGLALVGGVIAGALFGLCAWFFLLTGSTGFALVSIGRFDNSTPRPDQPTQANWIEEPQVAVERMKSQNFARSVADRARLPELVNLLPAKQYGGTGALNIRSLRDPNLLEIKVSSKDADIARAAITAIVEQLIEEHRERVEPLLRDFALKLKILNDLADEARRSHDRLTKTLDGLPEDFNGQQVVTLLALKSLADNNLAAVEKTALDVQVALSSQSTRNTRVLQAAEVIMPKFSTLWRTMALSALAGAILVFLCLPTGTGRNRRPPEDVNLPPADR